MEFIEQKKPFLHSVIIVFKYKLIWFFLQKAETHSLPAAFILHQSD